MVVDPVAGSPERASTVIVTVADATHAPDDVALTTNAPGVLGAVTVMLATPAAVAVAEPSVTPPLVKTTLAPLHHPEAVMVMAAPVSGLALLVVTIGVPTG